MKQLKHIGVYGLLLKDNKILLIKKCGGPYDGKLDLPGGTIEFNEGIEEALIREFKEEVGIDIIDYELFDVVSTNIKWIHKGEDLETKHIAILYKIINYENDIKNNIEITEINDDSMGAEYYDIKTLSSTNLSNIASLAIGELNVKDI